jgi:DNA-binding GntR family transcriptional regulator
LNRQVVSGSIFNYVQETLYAAVTKSFLSIAADASNANDQELLHLKPNEPVGLMSGIFFLDDGTPFEVSNMRLHYQYMKYTTFVSTNN